MQKFRSQRGPNATAPFHVPCPSPPFGPLFLGALLTIIIYMCAVLPLLFPFLRSIVVPNYIYVWCSPFSSWFSSLSLFLASSLLLSSLWWMNELNKSPPYRHYNYHHHHLDDHSIIMIIWLHLGFSAKLRIWQVLTLVRTRSDPTTQRVSLKSPVS